MVWYYHHFKIFPEFVAIHRVKGFSIVNEADVFLEFSCFSYVLTHVDNLISGSSAFSKTSLNIWKFMVDVLLKPGLENFEHYLLVCAVAATAKSLQSCPTLCDPIEGSPPGFPVPGIVQA